MDKQFYVYILANKRDGTLYKCRKRYYKRKTNEEMAKSLEDTIDRGKKSRLE